MIELALYLGLALLPLPLLVWLLHSRAAERVDGALRVPFCDTVPGLGEAGAGGARFAAGARDAERKLERACRAGDTAEAAVALVEVGRATWPASPPLSPGAVAARYGDPALRRCVDDLYVLRYSPSTQIAWEGGALWRAYRAARTLGRPLGRERAGLPLSARPTTRRVDRGATLLCSSELRSDRRSGAGAMKVLLIEDDATAADYLAKALGECGHTVDHVDDGMRGLSRATSEPYDALIVDRMLPSLDGLTVIETLRKSGNDTPVLIVSALGEVDERVRGLRAGGDDYLVKPFAFSELLARLDVMVNRHRGGSAPETSLRVADLEMDLLSRAVKRAGQTIELQPREFQLLEYLMRHADRVVTRTMLLEGVWDYHFDPQTNVIDVHISRLRGKIDKGFDPPLIHTVRGAGYRLRVPG